MDFEQLPDEAYVSNADVERVEKILQDDIRWALATGRGWNPAVGAHRPLGGAWEPNEPTKCGVCAVAAHVIRNQVAGDGGICDDAAVALGVPEDFVDDIYHAVLDSKGERYLGDNDDDMPSPGVALGWRLRDFADALVAEKGAK